jgi:hypothetical protein
MNGLAGVFPRIEGSFGTVFLYNHFDENSGNKYKKDKLITVDTKERPVPKIMLPKDDEVNYTSAGYPMIQGKTVPNGYINKPGNVANKTNAEFAYGGKNKNKFMRTSKTKYGLPKMGLGGSSVAAFAKSAKAATKKAGSSSDFSMEDLNTGLNALSTGVNFATTLANIGSIKGSPSAPKPVPFVYNPIPTKVNVEPQVSAINRMYRSGVKNVMNNTADSNTALGQANALYGQAIPELNKIYSYKENAERENVTKNVLGATEIQNKNIEGQNAENAMNFQLNLDKRTDLSKARGALATYVNTLAVDRNKAMRDQEGTNLIAKMYSANPASLRANFGEFLTAAKNTGTLEEMRKRVEQSGDSTLISQWNVEMPNMPIKQQ